MTINEVIKWYKDKEAEYKYLLKEYEDFAMMAEQYHQFVEWLTELKDLREENKVLTSECDRLIKEKGELLSKVSGGDVLRICQLEERLQAELDNSHCLEIELTEAKRLLKMAVEDMRWVDESTHNADGTCIMRKNEGCDDCPFDSDDVLWCKWKHEGEALKLIES